jgi:uncharacterized protein involved in exopolysaccharide biosynthesis
MDMKIDVEIGAIDSSIKANEIEKEKTEKEIGILKKKLTIIGQRKTDLNAEMKSVWDKVQDLEQEQRVVLKKEKRSEMESLGMLIYSNEILQSLRTYDILNEKLTQERIKEEDIHSDLEKQNAEINKIENTINSLKQKKGRIDETKVIKVPTRSIDPVSPKKKLNVIIAALLGFTVFVLLAFFLDYLKGKTE